MRIRIALCLFLGMSIPAVAFEAADLPTRPPEGAKPLSGDEIRSLLGGGTRFNFVGVSAPITGTGYWDPATMTAYGAYEIDQRMKGSWSVDWFIDGDRNCLGYSLKGSVCHHIYPHGDGGFLEVNLDGKVHTVYTPIVPQRLPVALSVDEVRTLMPEFLIWNLEDGVEVGDVRRDGDRIVADIVAKDDGKLSRLFVVDADTGAILSPVAHAARQPSEGAGSGAGGQPR
jgi:hypothetical protein